MAEEQTALYDGRADKTMGGIAAYTMGRHKSQHYVVGEQTAIFD